MWLGIVSPAAFVAGGRVGQCQGRSLESTSPQHLELAVGHGRVWSGLSRHASMLALAVACGASSTLFAPLLCNTSGVEVDTTQPVLPAQLSFTRTPALGSLPIPYALAQLLAYWLRPLSALPRSAPLHAPPKRSHLLVTQWG